jgi:hypothetical protein
MGHHERGESKMQNYSWWIVGLLAMALVLLVYPSQAGEIPWGLTKPHGVLDDQTIPIPHDLPTVDVSPCDNEEVLDIVKHAKLKSVFSPYSNILNVDDIKKLIGIGNMVFVCAGTAYVTSGVRPITWTIFLHEDGKIRVEVKEVLE